MKGNTLQGFGGNSFTVLALRLQAKPLQARKTIRFKKGGGGGETPK